MLVPHSLLCYNSTINKRGVIIVEIDAMIKRINELAHKKKNGGLTEEELAEQKELYKLYLGNIRGQLKSQLDNITVVDAKPPVQH